MKNESEEKHAYLCWEENIQLIRSEFLCYYIKEREYIQYQLRY